MIVALREQAVGQQSVPRYRNDGIGSVGKPQHRDITSLTSHTYTRPPRHSWCLWYGEQWAGTIWNQTVTWVNSSTEIKYPRGCRLGISRRRYDQCFMLPCLQNLSFLETSNEIDWKCPRTTPEVTNYAVPFRFDEQTWIQYP